MRTSILNFKKVGLHGATLQVVKPRASLKFKTEKVKIATIPTSASKLKHEGYLFCVSKRYLIN